MTDPQLDISCTACATERPPARLDDDGLCPDCRTPAGRLVTALRERGINDAAVADHWSITVAGMDADADDQQWTIGGTPEHEWKTGYDVTIPAAANAIAAIVQAPGLRARIAELEGENARLRSALHQAKVAARFPAASDAWDQVRDAVSALDAGGAS